MDYKEKKIRFQKQVATELMEKLEIVDPLCILAGGAPRDFFFGEPCNDLDFYIHIPQETMTHTALRFKRLGLKLKPLAWDGAGIQYKCMEHLKRVYDGEYKGMRFQVMLMNESTTKSVINHFGTSVCKIWWKDEKQGVQPTLEFLLSHYWKFIFKKEDYTAKTLHVDKMMKRYPDYKVLDYSSLENEKNKLARSLNVYPDDWRILEALKEKFYGK